MISIRLKRNSKEVQKLVIEKETHLMVPVSHQGPGMTFGQLALIASENINPLKNIKRAATVRCVTDC